MHWDLLKITQPSNTWEYMERGIHKQDDLQDYTGAIADYQQSIAMNNLGNKIVQLVTVARRPLGNSILHHACSRSACAWLAAP